MITKVTWMMASTLLILGLLMSGPGCAKPAPTPTPTPAAPTPAPAPAPKPASTPSPSPTATPTPTLKPIEMKWAGYHAVAHLHTVSTQKTIEEIEKRSKGQIKITFFPAEQLLKSAELYDAVAAGRVEAVSTVPSFEEVSIPLTQVLSQFGLWKSYAQLAAAYRPVIDALQPEYNKKGVYLAGLTGNTFYGMLSSKKMIYTPDDLKGLRLRVGSKTWVTLLEAAGAAGVFMGTPDVYTAIQRGTIDGTPWVIPSVMTYKLHEVAKYYSATTVLGLSWNAVYLNLKWLDSLPKEYRDIITDSVRQVYNIVNHNSWVQDEQKIKEELKKVITVVDLNDAQNAAWDKLALPVTKKTITDLGPDGQKLVDIIKKYER